MKRLLFAALAACSDSPAISDGGSTPDSGTLTRTDADRPVADAARPGADAARSDAGAPPGDCRPRTSGRLFLERRYETEDASELYLEQPVGNAVFLEGGGHCGSNAWEVRPNGDSAGEGSIGWHTVDFTGGTVETLYVGYMLYVSSGMVDRMNEGVAGKMLDAHMFPYEDNQARQTIQWGSLVDDDDRPVGVAPALCKGGAGWRFWRQSTAERFDLRDYRDQWIWVEMLLDSAGGRTALWIETADGAFLAESESPLMERRADRASDWGEETPYVYPDGGWSYPGLMWGYWQRMDGVAFTDADFVRLDDLVISDAWIEPPR
jgi:hypothetical protein